jgi:hypothetical protein
MKLVFRILPAIFLFFLCTSLFGQKQFYVLGGVDLDGHNNDYEFEQKGYILSRGWNDPKYKTPILNLGINAAFHLRVNNFVGFELGGRVTEMGLGVHDTDFQNRNTIHGSEGPDYFLNGGRSSQGNFQFARFYYCDYVSAFLYLPLKGLFWTPYISAGVGMNYLPKSKIESTTSYFYQPTTEDLSFSCYYAHAYMQTQFEIGAFLNSSDQGNTNGLIVFLGLRYCHAGTMFTGDYRNSQNGNVLYTDHVRADGDYGVLTLKVGNVFQIESGNRAKVKTYH